MILEQALDDLHVAFTRRWWTQLFTVFVRCLLALAFIPPSIPKILHKPFTVLPDSNPVGHYFNALMDTGFYYEFIGWSQIIAALLLLFPRTAHIGALLFVPIIANIAILTCSVGFKGTWILTILMAFAGLYLVGWEYDRLKPMLFHSRVDKPRRFKFQWIVIPAFFAVGGIAMAVLWWLIGLGNFANYFNVGGGLTIIGAIFGITVAAHYLYARWPFEQENRIVLRLP